MNNEFQKMYPEKFSEITQGAAAMDAMEHAPAVFAAGYSPNADDCIGLSALGTRRAAGSRRCGRTDKDRPALKIPKFLAFCEIFNGTGKWLET
jgi:hypothetical protein